MKVCPKCGAPMAEDRLGGHCPRCLMQHAIGSDDQSTESPEQPMADSSKDPPAGAKIQYFGDYELLEELGRGGMGIVYKARQSSLNRMVALKMIRSGELASENEVKRFRVEAEAAANLDHPNIVTVYEVGEHAKRQYLTMRLVEGQNLAEHVVALVSPLAGTSAAALMAKVARAIHHAHQRRILHRDLKPSNILIDAAGEPHVADFGLAKQVDVPGDVTLTGVLLGTPSYMSPEQATGQIHTLTTATDVYGLGALLYFTMTGRPPFRGGNALETLQMVKEREPDSPTSINPKVDRDLETICLKCLEKDPNRRYNSADAVAGDLERTLKHEPILARKTSRSERVWRWSRRNPILALLSGGLAVTAVLGLAAVTWQWVALVVAASIAGLVWQNRHVKIRISTETNARAVAEKMLNQLDVHWRIEQLGSHDQGNALIHLTHALRKNPMCQIAADRLLSGQTKSRLRPPVARLLIHQAIVVGASFNRSGRHVVTASEDCTARVWDTMTARTPPLILRHRGWVSSARFSPDGRFIATASGDGTARAWDVGTGQPVTAPLPHEGIVNSAEFNADGSSMVTAAHDGTARIWRLCSPDQAACLLRHDGAVYCAQFSPDGCQILTASGDHTARIWDATTGRQLLILRNHSQALTTARFSPDGQTVVTASHDGTACLWDVRSGRLRRPPLRHDGSVSYAEFSPDSQTIATASADQTARVWDVLTGRPMTNYLMHRGEVTSARFSPDARRLITACRDGSARVWDVFLEVVITQLDHSAPVAFAEFNPDGQKVVSCAMDETARIWKSPAAKLPVPEWVPEFAEAVVGRRLNDRGFAEPVSKARLLRFRMQLAVSSATDLYSEWAREFLEENKPPP
jgi:eukaryotic-like serine/threonine-protein kinase